MTVTDVAKKIVAMKPAASLNAVPSSGCFENGQRVSLNEPVPEWLTPLLA